MSPLNQNHSAPRIALDLHGTTALGTAYLCADNSSTEGTNTSDQPTTRSLKPALVFIHGVGMNHAVWQPQLDHFRERYQVITYDLLGHGRSPLPKQNATLDDYTNQLDELLNHLGIESAHIIGHSMGALISVHFALRFPEKVQSLIPMNIVYQRNAQQRDAVLSRAKQVLKEGKISGIEITMLRWFTDKPELALLGKIGLIRKWLKEASPIGYGRTYRLFAESDRIFDGQLGQLSIPALYLTGQNDPNSTPEMSQAMAEDTPHGHAVTLPDEAHMMAFISPQICNSVIDHFFKSTRPGFSQTSPSRRPT